MIKKRPLIRVSQVKKSSPRTLHEISVWTWEFISTQSKLLFLKTIEEVRRGVGKSLRLQHN